MFDANSGTLNFDMPPVAIGPSLTREGFLGSTLAGGAATHVANEPYHSWKLDGTFRSDGLDLIVVLWFRGQRLTTMSLMDADPRFGTGWDDHSRKKEMARKASHDAWLSRSFRRRRSFAWGSVTSAYDERGDFSDIVVTYQTSVI